MIEIVEQEGNIICLQAKGILTHNDYQQVLIPRLEQVIKKHGKARMLLAMGEDFHGWEPSAMWDDAKFGMQHRMDFEKCAVVGGPKWVEWATKVGALIIPCEIKTFPSSQLTDAHNWIKAPIVAPAK
jgi:hypothetical protein